MTIEVSETHRYHEFDIPVPLLNLTGAGPDSFDAISEHHIQSLQKHVGLESDHKILEIGCGIGRDAIPLTKILSSKGSYLGVDIIGKSIDWCKSNISEAYPNFSFLHYNVEDQLHNPQGATKTTDIILPIDDQSIDRIILWSVFTHMFENDISHYLKEFKRVLKPGGLIYATWFIVNNNVLANARLVNLTAYNLRFEHAVDSGCYINDPVHPLGAVAYTETALNRMISSAGLKCEHPFLRGAWSGYWPDPQGGQDVTILSVAPPLVSYWFAIKHFFRRFKALFNPR